MADMDTDEILQLIIEVAAEIIVPRFKALGDDQIEQKSPGDFVTVADREAEVRITERLLARQPGALVVGEEATFAERSNWPAWRTPSWRTRSTRSMAPRTSSRVHRVMR